MIIRCCLLGYLLSVSYFAAAQQRLTGKITDAATGQPVPYVSVSVLNTRLGTTSNADGEFEIRAVPLPARLIVSHLSYARDTLAVVAGQVVQIRLQPASVLLTEAPVGGYLEELIAKAYRQLRRDHPRKTYGQAFYRQITRLDGEATEVQEMIWNTKASSGRVEGTALAHARYAKKKALISFMNFSLYTKAYGFFDADADSSSSTGIVSLNAARNYTLRLLGVTENGPQQLVEIGFVSKTSDVATPVQGSLVIEESTHQILRFRLKTSALNIKSNNPTFRFKNQATTFEMVFLSAPAGADLDYITITYQGAIGRPLKDDLGIQVASFTSFYGRQPTPGSGITYAGATAGQSDLAAIKQTTYDPAFWQNNSAVKRTPLEEEVIKSFEQKGAFGTLLSP